ncbi:MAG TPA: hypothetical protein GX733_05725 [Tissierellia bacterium]|jgi:prepilin signal peptidase PulO-like enzyme (type II secretory pathway)|nr:hypothetical protein [Tissierellia bacterium]
MLVGYLFVLAMISWFDLSTCKIPDEWILVGIILRFLSGAHLDQGWLAVTIGFVLLTRGGLGWGDVKLAMLLYMSGADRLLRVSLSFFVAAIFGGILLMKRHVKKESHLPMAPFLIFIELFFL